MSQTNKFMRGTPLLIGDNTVPGLKLPEELSRLIPEIIQTCHDFNLDFYPIVVQKLTYDEISEGVWDTGNCKKDMSTGDIVSTKWS